MKRGIEKGVRCYLGAWGVVCMVLLPAAPVSAYEWIITQGGGWAHYEAPSSFLELTDFGCESGDPTVSGSGGLGYTYFELEMNFCMKTWAVANGNYPGQGQYSHQASYYAAPEYLFTWTGPPGTAPRIGLGWDFSAQGSSSVWGHATSGSAGASSSECYATSGQVGRRSDSWEDVAGAGSYAEGLVTSAGGSVQAWDADAYAFGNYPGEYVQRYDEEPSENFSAEATWYMDADGAWGADPGAGGQWVECSTGGWIDTDLSATESELWWETGFAGATAAVSVDSFFSVSAWPVERP